MAQAATFEVVEYNDETVLVMSGQNEYGDFQDFLAEADGIDSKTLYLLDSPGGLTIDAYRIGRYLHDNEWTTVITKGSECASACALLWLGGSRAYD